jgi:hypothetical protein
MGGGIRHGYGDVKGLFHAIFSEFVWI